MSIQAVAWALEQDLPARPKLVLVSIANHANHVDGYCWLKAETIAREAACTPRSVYNFVGALVRNGFIRKAPRKGEDGKQRANDYWLLLAREEASWDYGAHLESDDGQDEAGESEGAETEAPDVVPPTERRACGETPEPYERHDSRQPVEMSPGSVGPTEGAFSRQRIAEPSKPNAKASGAGARVQDRALRAYRPPPPQPVGADPGLPTKQVFVFEGSRAYDAWAAVKSREMGLRNWHLVTRANIDGHWRSGWYFPMLFPPDDKSKSGSTDPPRSSSAA